MVGILIFLIVAFYLRFKIASIYEDAIKSYKNKDYIVAIEKFESIGDYKDSYTYIENAKNEIKYQKALDYLEDDNYEEAIEMFEKIINYHVSKAKIKQAKYEWALFLYKNEQYLKAEQLFAELDSYSNSLLYKAKCSLKMIENDNMSMLVNCTVMENMKRHLIIFCKYLNIKIAINILINVNLILEDLS